MIIRKKVVFIFHTLLLLGVFGTPVFSQISQSNTEVQAKLLLIEDLVENNMYLPAQNIMNECINSPCISDNQKADLEFLNAFISLNLDLREGSGLVEKFESRYPEYSRLEMLKKAKGDYYFKRKRYKNAVREYQYVKPNNLNSEDREIFFFRLGYSYFMIDKPKKAKAYLYKVKDSKSKYAASALYYYSHICYDEKKYETALKGFEALENHPTFNAIVPFYISQIYFQEERYEELLKTAPVLYNKAKGKRKNEISKLLGDACFRLERYSESIEYLEYYKNSSRSNYTKEDYYQLAFAYMKSEEYPLAIKYFEKVGNKKSELSQYALYNLGNSYLKTHQKEFAGKAFYAAYQMDYDTTIKEDAMFNFAKISYELSNDPYNRAIEAIQKYIKTYPHSPRKNEAYAYMVNLFLSAKNSKGALETLNDIPNRSTELNKAYQLITYNRASVLYGENRYKEAADIYKKSLQYPLDKSISLKAKYWLADCYYQQRKYYDAIKLWKELQSNYNIKDIEENERIPYNIAFSYYMLNKYNEAIHWFHIVINNPETDLKIISDTYLHIGDCYYIIKEFSQAIAYYSKALKMNEKNADYAMYQRALAYGGEGNLNKKAKALNQFYKRFPKSSLSDDALFELGTTYLLFDKNQLAIKNFSEIINQFPNSPFKRRAMLKIGLTYYNMDRNQDALIILKQVVDQYSGTKESLEALASIRNIYIESNAAEDFFTYAQNIPFANISNNQQDSISYIATENVYMNGDYTQAIQGFNSYLSDYPEGAFSINAHFYRGECYMITNDYSKALSDYEYVLSHSQMAFREPALIKSARIYRHQENYEQALINYRELFEIASNEMDIAESLDGKLECYHQLQMSDSVLVLAKLILSSPKTPEQTLTKAHAYLAHAAMISEDLSLASKEYSIVSELMKGETAAEAKYQQALIQYKLKNYKDSESLVFDLIKNFGSYDYWVARGYILLADIYVKYGNNFQAIQTLQSIIEYQEDSNLVHIAIKKKKIIEELDAIEQYEEEAPLEIDSIVLEPDSISN